VDEALLELALRFQATFINENFGFDFLLEVVWKDHALAGEAVFEGVLAGLFLAFLGGGALGFLAVFPGGLVLGFGAHWLNPREVKELEIENHNRGNGVAVSEKVSGEDGEASTDACEWAGQYGEE
jgi:hypothetical protein